MYAKIFSQIYDGTLCTNGPWQALVTFQQLLILADQDGDVDMTTAAISRKTTIPIEIIELGIAALLLPDPESRTPTQGGRRIIPLAEGRSWGWKVVNYKHYRQIKREEDRREYHREYWKKRKLNQDSTPLNTLNTTQPAQPIAEAYTYAEANTKDQDQKRGKDQRPVRFAPPSLLQVSDYCKARGNTVDPTQFINFYEAKGWMIGKNKMKDWKAAVRTWEQREKSGSRRTGKKTYEDYQNALKTTQEIKNVNNTYDALD